jgi:hypothetical protein
MLATILLAAALLIPTDVDTGYPGTPDISAQDVCGGDVEPPFGFAWRFHPVCFAEKEQSLKDNWEGAMFMYLAAKQALEAEMEKAIKLTNHRREQLAADPTNENLKHLYLLAFGAEEGIRNSLHALEDATKVAWSRLIDEFKAELSACCQLIEQ